MSLDGGLAAKVEEDTKADEEVKEAVEELQETVEEAVEEIKQTDGVVIADECIEKIADRVYDKMKAFANDLVTASEDVEQLVSESVSAKAEEVTPPEEAAEEAAPEDVKPERSHRLFSKPLRKRE